MKRRKHKKDRRKVKIDKFWQGYVSPSNKTLRKMLERLSVSSGAMYRKIGGWFEYN